MGDKHLPKLKPGTSRVMVGLVEFSVLLESSRGFKGSKTSTMIWEEALVGDILGEDEPEQPPRSPEEILRTSLCWPSFPRGL